MIIVIVSNNHSISITLLDQGAFPYLTLGVTPNVPRTYFPSVADGSSEAIHILRGFPFGRSNHTTVFVSLLEITWKMYDVLFILFAGVHQWVLFIW